MQGQACAMKRKKMKKMLIYYLEEQHDSGIISCPHRS